MIGFLRSLLKGGEPILSDASARDAAAIAALHAASFRRGWSGQEVESLLLDRHVVAHRALAGQTFAGQTFAGQTFASQKLAGQTLTAFIMSRQVEDEAEILSIAVAGAKRGRGLARDLLTLHLRRLAGLGCRTVFLEVDENNTPAIRLYDRAGFHEISRRPNYYPAPGAKPAAALVLRRDLA